MPVPRYLGFVTVSDFLERKHFLWIFLVTLLAFDCSAPIAERTFPRGDENAKTLFFVNYGWHSALVIKKADIPAAVVPEITDFPEAEYLEFGWGDRDYYQAADPGFFMALKAAFLSRGSVLHVTGFKGPVGGFFSNAEIVEIVTSAEAFQRLVQFISNSFSRSPDTWPDGIGPGLYANSRFYPATGRFHLFRTCNTWVATALSAAGLPLSPVFAVTAGSLSRQVKQLNVPPRGRCCNGS